MRNSKDLPIAGCVVAILEWIKSTIENALQSPWLADAPIDPVEVVEIPGPSSPTTSKPPSPNIDPVEAVERAWPSSPITPPSPSSNEAHDFVIFLSFRGEDTRNGFTSHLHSALQSRCLKTFINSEDLHKGEKIEELFGYIEKSKVFLPIISKGYADAKWCLKEIAKIVECAGSRQIVPIFFGVEPSDVRHQTGPFQSAFNKYDKEKVAEVQEWRDALTTVADLSSYTLKDANGNEAKLVEKVVGDLLLYLDSGHLFVADHPVDMQTRVEAMMKLLQIESGGVKMVGIVGTGGIGKTTIAKAVFNKLRSNFGAATVLTNVREHWKTPTERTRLMRRLVEEILEDRVTPVPDFESGQRMFRERVPSNKLLIVLDDVDHVDQFREVIGESHRFTSGSRIIITTRDEGLLSRCGVDKGNVYKPMLLDPDQSLDLFSSHAFRITSHQPREMYMDMSKKVVAVAGGLPLALKVFGSYLIDKIELDEWQEYLDQLQQSSEQDIQKCLQISYEGLSNVEKKIFLDIACFFLGHSEVEATLMWESLKYPKSSIKALQQKSLITRVRDDGPFEMHDLIRDMGRDIIRQVEPDKPWTWSRTWTAEDSLKTLWIDRRNDAIEGINISDTGEELSTEVFREMINLRVLRINNVRFKGENFMLPVDLKILFLRLAKINSLSSCNFQNLVTLELHVADEMSELLVTESASKVFNALKFLKISCHSIRVTPDFSNMPNLELLEFSYCASLVEVHESIGNLRKLKYLMFLQFLNVEKLPNVICQLTSLETLRIRQFPRLESLPDRLGDLESLNMLEIEDLPITNIPSSIGQLTKLRELYLRKLDRLHSLPDSISSLNSLQVFNIEGTDLKAIKIDGVDLMNINQLEISSCDCLTVLPAFSLKKARGLSITDSTTEELPQSLEAMGNIERLSLRCKNLKALPDWFPNLENLKAFEAHCESITLIMINKIFSLRSIESLLLCCAGLEELPAAMVGIFVEKLRSFTLRCKNLKALPEWIGSLASLHSLKLEACENITELPFCIGNLSRLQELGLNGCERIRSVPQFPSSLLALDASNCSDLEKTLDISNLKYLKKLRLGGCRLLEDVKGIENTAENMEELVLPGPYGSIGCSCLSEDFKNKVFKELAFESLCRFEIWGSLAPGSVTGNQQISFMLPNRENKIKPVRRIERLVLNNVLSPIRITLVEDDHSVIFKSTLEVQRPIVKNFFRPIWIPLPRTFSKLWIHYKGQIAFDGSCFFGVPCHESCARSSQYAVGGSEVVEVASEDGHKDYRSCIDETEAEEQAYEIGEPVVRIEVQEEVTGDGCQEDGGRDSTEAGEAEAHRVLEVLNEPDQQEVIEDGSKEDGDHASETEAEGEVYWETGVVDEVEEVAEDGIGGRDRDVEDEHHGCGNKIRACGPKIIQVFQPNRVPYFLASYPSFVHWQREYSVRSCDYEVNFQKEDQIQEHLRMGNHAKILVSVDTSNLTTVRMIFSFTGED